MPPQTQKRFTFGYTKKASAHSESHDLEKQASPQRITYEETEISQKSSEPLEIPFRSFIKPYSKSYGSCKVTLAIVSAALLLILMIVALLFCGVVQEAKEHAISESTGEVAQQYTVSPTTSAGYL